MIKETTLSSHYLPRSYLTPWASLIVLVCLTMIATSSRSEPALMVPLHEIKYEELPPSWLLTTPEPSIAAAKQAPVDQSMTKAEEVTIAKKVPEAKKVPKANNLEKITKTPTIDKIRDKTIQPVVKQPTQPPQMAVAATPKIAPHLIPLKKLIPAATQGNADAQYELGMRYQYGNGVPKSRHKAHRWLSQSANTRACTRTICPIHVLSTICT